MDCKHPNGICDCNFPWQAYADWVDPPPDPMTEEIIQVLIERLKAKGPKKIILCSNPEPGTEWMKKWQIND